MKMEMRSPIFSGLTRMVATRANMVTLLLPPAFPGGSPTSRPYPATTETARIATTYRPQARAEGRLSGQPHTCTWFTDRAGRQRQLDLRPPARRGGDAKLRGVLRLERIRER